MANNLSGQFDLVTATEGTALPTTTDVASFTDGTTTDTAANFTATIDWGDGTTTTGTVVGASGSFTVQGGHTYADDGFYQPVATITRTTDSAQLVLQGGVNAGDADNLTGQGQPTIVANPSQALTNVVVATFTNNPSFTNVPTDFTVNIDWGDGTTTAGTLALNGSTYTVTGSHTYASAGNFTISTFMNDDTPDTSVGFATTQAAIGFGGTEVFNSATETIAVPTGTTVATFVDNANLPSTDYTASIAWGDGTTTAGTVSGSPGSFTVTSASDHTYADEGIFTPVVTITRTTDSTTVALSGTATVAEADNLSAAGVATINGNPGVALNNVTVATFGDSNTQNIAGDFVATIDWGDGTSSTGTISGSSGSFSVAGSHTYTQNGQDTITVSIGEDASDGQGTAQSIAHSTALIGLAPGSGSTISATEGTAIAAGTQVATFTDGNATDTAASFTASIDWGDGTTTAGTVSGASGAFTVTGGPHTYADERGLDNAVTTTVTRTADSATTTITGHATVGEADALSLTADNISGFATQPLNNVQVATFTDTYAGNVASDFTAFIAWGDGTTTTGTVSGSSGAFTVNGSHTYATGGTDQLKVSVVDDGVGTATASGSATATIAVRTLAGQMVLNSATEGTALPNNTAVATFTDNVGSDAAGDFTATINWGDGVTTTGTVVGSAGSFTVEGGHSYADEGADPASVTLTHTADQAQATASGTVSAAEGDVLTPQGTTGTATPNQAFSGAVATFSDTDTANVAGDFTATVDWGDGTTTTGTVVGANGAFTVDGSHTYTTGGQFTVHVQGADDSPGTATFAATSTIAVRALTGQMVLTSATEGTALPNTTAVATFTDTVGSDMAGDFTATINWGDGVTTTGTVVGSAGSFTVEGGHTYRDEGGNPASVTLTHTADQVQGTASGTVSAAEGDVLTPQGTAIAATVNHAFSGPVATFSDTDTANVAGDFTAMVDWGDGTTTTGTVVGSNGAFTVDGSHTYATGGKFTVHVQGADDSPGTATFAATSTATVGFPGQMVLNAATEGKKLPNATAVATFTDNTPGDTASSFTATINWGDGVTTAGTVEGSGGMFTVDGSHRYADEGSDSATVTLTRKSDQLQSTASGSVAVAEGDVLTPHGTIAVALPTFSGTIATFTDTDTFNVKGDFAASIDWGDGTTTTGTVSGSNGAFSVNGSHTYTQTALETVKVKLTDDAPGTATATATSLILAVDPPPGGGYASAGGTPLLWRSGDVTPSNWLHDATTPVVATASSNSESRWQLFAPPDHFTENVQGSLLFQNMNGGAAPESASDSSGPASVLDTQSPSFPGADMSRNLAGGDPSGSLHGTLTSR
jgi:hypothetical protein